MARIKLKDRAGIDRFLEMPPVIGGPADTSSLSAENKIYLEERLAERRRPIIPHRSTGPGMELQDIVVPGSIFDFFGGFGPEPGRGSMSKGGEPGARKQRLKVNRAKSRLSLASVFGYGDSKKGILDEVITNFY